MVWEHLNINFGDRWVSNRIWNAFVICIYGYVFLLSFGLVRGASLVQLFLSIYGRFSQNLYLSKGWSWICIIEDGEIDTCLNRSIRMDLLGSGVRN